MARDLSQITNAVISKAKAQEFINAYREEVKPHIPITNGNDSGAFKKEDVLRVLNQNGCIGLAYYYAKNKDGDYINEEYLTVVLVGVDEEGNDMVDGIILDRAVPCPPECANVGSNTSFKI